MAHKDGSRSGGRRPGSLNRKTKVRIEATRRAAEAMANQDGSGVFAGDAHALLMAMYKNESFTPEFRAHCAGMALKFEKPALQAVDSTVREERPYVVAMMPAPVESLEEWKRLYMNGDNTPTAEGQALEERFKSIAAEAQTKKLDGPKYTEENRNE
jgi:hypothetical protein